MLHQAVQDTPNTERRLNDVWHKLSECDVPLLLLKLDNLGIKLDLTAGNALDRELDPTVLVHADRELLAHLLGEFLECSLNSLGVLLESGARLFLIENRDPLLDYVRLLELFTCL